MRILLGTPAYGGLLTTQYAGSLLLALQYFKQEGIHIQVMFLGNESLIPRARNKILNWGIDSGQFDKVLFVDADIGFTPLDLEKLLKADRPIIGGTYPAKEYPLRLVFGVSPGHSDLDSEVVEVKYVPTGFLLIDCAEVKKLQPRTKRFLAQDPHTKSEVWMHDYFPTGVREDYYESEDWGFCTLVRESGLQVFLHTGVVLTHTGTHTFQWGEE